MADEILEEVVLEPEVEVEPEVKEAPREEVSAEDGIESLKTQLAQEQEARQQAEAARQEADRRAREIAAQATEAHKAKHESDVALVTNAIDTIKGQQDLLEQNLAAAASAGDWTEHAKFHRQMSENAAKLAQLEVGKESLEARKDEPIIHQITDPVELMASQLTPRSAAWIRAHPDYARDPRLTQRMLAAHNLAVTDNIATDTDAYFSAIERTLGIRKEVVREEESPLSDAGRETPPPSAPARKDRNGTRVTLSASEREMAEMMGMTEQEYAKNKVALQREGKLN